MSFNEGNLHDRCEQLQRENDELRGYIADLCGILDEIYKPLNVKIMREIIDFCRDERGIEVDA